MQYFHKKQIKNLDNIGYDTIESIVYEDLGNKYPNWTSESKNVFIKDGKLEEQYSFDNGLKTLVFVEEMGGLNLFIGPFVKENNRYYLLNKNILDKYFTPLNNIEDAKNYFMLLKQTKELPELRTKLIDYTIISKIEDYKNSNFVSDFSNLKNETAVSSFKLENNIYKIEEVYFNYEEKAFLIKIDYEMDKNGNISLKDEKILNDYGEGLIQGRDYIY